MPGTGEAVFRKQFGREGLKKYILYYKQGNEGRPSLDDAKPKSPAINFSSPLLTDLRAAGFFLVIE